MQRPTLVQNIAIAIVLTIFVFIAGFIFRQLFYGQTAVKSSLAAAAILYSGYCLYHSQRRIGKLILGLLALLVISCSTILLDSITAQVLAIIGMLWMLRSLLYYSSLLAAGVDLAVTLFGLASAYWVYYTSDSITQAVWAFLLLQSLLSLLPQQRGRIPRKTVAAQQDRFNHAHQTAESALRQLVNKMQ